MALLRSEAIKLDVPYLIPGVVKHIINRWPFTGEFETFDAPEGDNVTWNRQLTIGSGTAVDPNEDLTGVESAPTYTETTRQLRLLAREVRVDNFIRQTQSKQIDVREQAYMDAVQGLMETWMDKTIYGDNATNSKEFSGWHKLTDDANQGVSEAGSALNLSNVEIVKYQMMKKPGLRYHILLNAQLLGRFAAYVRKEAGAYVTWTKDNFGQPLEQYGGIPIHLTDFLTMTETNADPPTKTGSNTTTMRFMGFGSVIAGGMAWAKIGEFVERTPFDRLESYDAGKLRLMMKGCWIDGSRYSSSQIRGITDAAVAA